MLNKPPALLLASSVAIALTTTFGMAHAQSGTTGVSVALTAVPAATAPRRRPPHPLAGVASIIEADVIAARYTFDDSLGPRTEVTLDNIVVHAGNAPAEKVFSQLGGPLPNGHYMGISELPVLHPGSRYILFLAATPWFYTPIWTGLAFRVEPIGDRKIVLGLHGRPVLSFDSTGVRFGSTQMVDPQTQKDPLQPLPRVASFSASLPDVANALDASTFGQAAMAAAKTVGAPLGTASLRAVPRTPWNVQRTVAPTVP
jgi:hypothetical protein